ncbi:hypothetical protein ScPMuIL_003107 [Solemya velum]
MAHLLIERELRPRRSPLRPLYDSSSPSENVGGQTVLNAVSPDEELIQQRRAVRTSPRKRAAFLSTPEAMVISGDSTKKSPSKRLDFDTGVTPVRNSRIINDGIRKRLVMYSPMVDSEDTFPKALTPKRRRARKSSTSSGSCSLQQRFSALSSSQLAEVLEGILQHHPDLQQEVEDLLPSPDVTPLVENLEYFRHNIFKSFPNSRWGTSRDAFCFRRVKTHIESFKEACIKQGKQLLDSESWASCLDYVLSAWEAVDSLPDWDNPTHNKLKEMCFKGLSSQCKQAVKKSVLDKDLYQDLKTRLQEAAKINQELESCVALVEQKLKKL